MAERLLDVKDLSTHFFTHAGVVKAVNGVSFTLDRNETIGIVGESGSGKTVAALSLMRLIPDPPGKVVEGSLMLGERNLRTISDDEMRAVRGNDIAMIFQDPMTSLNPVMKIGKQIAEAITLHQDKSKRDAWKMAIDLLARVGIPDAPKRVDQYPFEFSGGMRQRAMIAMAISCNPDILIADEPTTALDVTIQAQIIDVMREMQAQFELRRHPDHARPRRDRRDRRQGDGDVRRPHRGVRSRSTRSSTTPSPVHVGTAGLAAAPRRHREGAAHAHQGPAAEPHHAAGRAARSRSRCPYGATSAATTGRSSRSSAAEHGVHCWIPVEERLALRVELPALQGVRGVSLLEVSGLKKHFPIRTGVLKRTTGWVYAVDGVSLRRSRRARPWASSARAAAASPPSGARCCVSPRRRGARSRSRASTS